MEALVLALACAVAVALAAFAWKRLRVAAHCRAAVRGAWEQAHAGQLREIAELRADLDACLRVLDRFCTGGSGDLSTQFGYAESQLEEIGKRGIWSRSIDG